MNVTRHLTPWTRPALRTAGVTLLLLLVPLVAMQFTREVSWGLGDFLAAALLLFTAGMSCAIGFRFLHSRRQRWTAAFVVFAGLATVWAELAVGLFD